MSFFDHNISRFFAEACPPYAPGTDSFLTSFLGIDAETARLNIKRQYFHEYYDEKISDIRTFFKDSNYDVADALFDILIELKAGKLRKNGYIPDIGHEIDQILPVIDAIQNMSDEEKQEIEEQHGSLERWLCSVIVHDMGEDYGFFHSDIVDKVKAKLSKKGINITRAHDDIIDCAGRSMERLTHYRKFSYEDVQDLAWGAIEGLPDVKPGQIVPLDHLKHIFWPEMDVLEHGSENLQVFAVWNDKTNAPTVVVTRYGRSPVDAEEAIYQYGADWHAYLSTIISEDIYDALTKMGDRINGIATRLEINALKPKKYETYLRESDYTFDKLGIRDAIKNHVPDNNASPLLNYVDQLEAMMRLMSQLGHHFVNTHPDLNPGGKRGISWQNLNSFRRNNGVGLLRVSEYMDDALKFYDGVDQQSHPIGMYMRDLRQFMALGYYAFSRALYNDTEETLLESGPPEMRHLIQGERVKVYKDDWDFEEYPAQDIV